MKSVSERSDKIRNLIRMKLKAHSFSYRALAKQLGVSESTVKRWMTKDDWPLDKLLTTFSVLKISWLDVQQNEEHFEPARPYLEEDLENFVVQHPREAYVFLLFAKGYDFKKIAKKLNVSPQTLETMFIKLDRHRFVAYTSPKQIRPLVNPPFRWTQSGRFSKKYFMPCAKLLFTELVEANTGFVDHFNAHKALVNVSEMILSETSLARFKSDLYDLIGKYRETSKLESAVKDPLSTSPVGLLVALDKFPLWEKIMWEQCRK